MTARIEPLASAVWFQRIEMIANGEFGSVERALRHASHLLQLAPACVRHAVEPAIDQNRFEALLESGDFDSAVRHLIATPNVLSMEKDSDSGTFRATLKGAAAGDLVHGTGDTAAAAALAAWTTRLLGLKPGSHIELLSAPLQPRHRDRLEPDRR